MQRSYPACPFHSLRNYNRSLLTSARRRLYENKLPPASFRRQTYPSQQDNPLQEQLPAAPLKHCPLHHKKWSSAQFHFSAELSQFPDPKSPYFQSEDLSQSRLSNLLRKIQECCFLRYLLPQTLFLSPQWSDFSVVSTESTFLRFSYLKKQRHPDCIARFHLQNGHNYLYPNYLSSTWPPFRLHYTPYSWASDMFRLPQEQ